MKPGDLYNAYQKKKRKIGNITTVPGSMRVSSSLPMRLGNVKGSPADTELVNAVKKSGNYHVYPGKVAQSAGRIANALQKGLKFKKKMKKKGISSAIKSVGRAVKGALSPKKAGAQTITRRYNTGDDMTYEGFHYNYKGEPMDDPTYAKVREIKVGRDLLHAGDLKPDSVVNGLNTAHLSGYAGGTWTEDRPGDWRKNKKRKGKRKK